MSWESDDRGSESNSLLQNQIKENEVELAAKKASLTKQRLAIVKSQDYPNFQGSGKNTPIEDKSVGV